MEQLPAHHSNKQTKQTDKQTSQYVLNQGYNLNFDKF